MLANFKCQSIFQKYKQVSIANYSGNSGQGKETLNGDAAKFSRAELTKLTWCISW